LLRELISYRLGIITTDPVDTKRQRLVDGLSMYLEDEAEMKAHFVGMLLGFDFSDSPYLKGVENDPWQLNERGQLYLTQYFAATAGKAVAATKVITILMLDDVHWADDASLSFVVHLIRECPQLPLLVVCLARPNLSERFPGWGKDNVPGDQSLPPPGLLPRQLHLELGPLSPQASQELLNVILRKVKAFPDELRQRILATADGNPFYLEEFIQSLVDANIIRKSQRGGPWRVDAERGGNFELPTTLIALLEASLDSLNTVHKVLLQQASVIGQVFWRSALQVLQGDQPIRSGFGLLSGMDLSILMENIELCR
jgi:hypothetical protein